MRERALAVGDAFCGDYYDGGGACDPEKVRAMLTLWGELPFDTVLPGHSPPCPREELGAVAHRRNGHVTGAAGADDK